jgi:predicted DnaQ family exonuclease/DinG family helicase
MNPNEFFIALDLETTGLDQNKDEIIEIGLSLFDKGKITKEFTRTINPGKCVSDNILILTGITQEELDMSPKLEELLPEIEDFIKDTPLIGHNVQFDLNFLRRYLSLSNKFYDTLILSRIYLPFANSHKLSYIGEYLNIPYVESHRAGEDANLCGRIFLKIFQIMCNINPEILKTQINILKGRYNEENLIKIALEHSLKKGLNRKSYPFEIPINFREEQDKDDGKFLTSISDYFQREHLEERPSQINMAELVQSALFKDGFLIVEASAGTGKSLAYLIPSILYSKSTGNKIYISSYTKNLQQQLFNQDIPKAEEITGFGINTILRKGKGNYLCLFKSKSMMGEIDPLSKSTIKFWESLTRTGDLSEIYYVFRNVNLGLINVDETCRKEACPFFNGCFYYNMIKRIKDANLILVNHSLFFTGNLNVERVIFDEAHEIEEAATGGYALRVNLSDIEVLLKTLLKEIKGKLKNEISEVMNIARIAFERFGESVLKAKGNSVGFYHNVDLNILLNLSDKLYEFLKILKGIDFDNDEIIERMNELISNLKILIRQNQEDRAFYYKLSDFNHPNTIEMIGAPLDIGPYLEEFLYLNLSSLVLTSATLSVGESFDFLKYILGLIRFGDRLKEISLPDTYNFKEQALTIVPKYLPFPEESNFIEEVSLFIKDIILPLNKGTLVLFTSFSHIKGVYQHIKDDFDERSRELLIQGFGKSKNKLLSLFKEKEGSVLLATGSFWQGVDIPGKALEIVIIEKLPFPNPSDPLIAAKSSYLEKKGLDGFSSYMLPLSVLRFKQGFGRLIRSTHDMGIIFVLDKRVINKWYGSIFLESLPTNISIVNSSLETNEAIRAWFEEGRIYTPYTGEVNWEEF